MELQNVVLVDGVRSAFARGGRGNLVATRLDDAAATVLRALLDRNKKVRTGTASQDAQTASTSSSTVRSACVPAGGGVNNGFTSFGRCTAT